MTSCLSTARDPVYVSGYTLNCVSPLACPTQGCFWRKFHGLPADKFCKRAEPAATGDLFS
jgi:hypothetical protein